MLHLYYVQSSPRYTHLADLDLKAFSVKQVFFFFLNIYLNIKIFVQNHSGCLKLKSVEKTVALLATKYAQVFPYLFCRSGNLILVH